MNSDQEGPRFFKAQPSLARYPDRWALKHHGARQGDGMNPEPESRHYDRYKARSLRAGGH